METSHSMRFRTRPAWAVLALLAGWFGGGIGFCQASSIGHRINGSVETFTVDSLSPLTTCQAGPHTPYSLPACAEAKAVSRASCMQKRRR